MILRPRSNQRQSYWGSHRRQIFSELDLKLQSARLYSHPPLQGRYRSLHDIHNLSIHLLCPLDVASSQLEVVSTPPLTQNSRRRRFLICTTAYHPSTSIQTHLNANLRQQKKQKQRTASCCRTPAVLGLQLDDQPTIPPR